MNRLLLLLLSLACLAAVSADEPADSAYFISYEGSVNVWGSTGRLAPYYILTGNQGRFTQGDGAELDLQLERPLRLNKRFEYAFGAEALAGWQRDVDYSRYNPDNQQFYVHGERPGAVRLQQLWGAVKYRGVFLQAGMRSQNNSLFNQRLGSGDMILSNNARPIPRVSAGFVDFQNIPFTNGWVQIQGELSWGKFMDSRWLENHYNYYNSFITTGAYMHYARCYFRTNPQQPLSVTVGMQHAAQFGGSSVWRKDGKVTSQHKNSVKAKDFINALFPWTGGSSTTTGDVAYYDGNHLGSWDLRIRYRLPNSTKITAYMQSPYEDGSGIGKLNGFDAVWGLEYEAANKAGWLTGAVAEYIDFTNQSGPMHWAPGDFPGTGVPSQATGADDYYNNYMYNGWANYGLAIGNPFCVSPIYNTDGYMRFLHNRVRGFQLGAEGMIGSSVDWLAKLSYRTSWGTPLMPALHRTHDTSALLQAAWRVSYLPGLKIKGAIAFDAGKLIGNNFGAFIALSYSGIL